METSRIGRAMPTCEKAKNEIAGLIGGQKQKVFGMPDADRQLVVARVAVDLARRERRGLRHASLGDVAVHNGPFANPQHRRCVLPSAAQELVAARI